MYNKVFFFILFTWLKLYTLVCMAPGLFHCYFKHQSVTITIARHSYLPNCSAVIQTDTVHMSDWLRVSFIFFTLSFCEEKISKPGCLISGDCNQSESRKSMSFLRKKSQTINGMETSFETNFSCCSCFFCLCFVFKRTVSSSQRC